MQCVGAWVSDLGRCGVAPSSATSWFCDLVQVSFLIFKIRRIVLDSQDNFKDYVKMYMMSQAYGLKKIYSSVNISMFLKLLCGHVSAAVLPKALDSSAHSNLPPKILVQ